MWTYLGHLAIIIPDYVLLNTLLKRKRSMLPLICLIEVKLLLVYIGFDYIAGRMYGGALWWQILYIVLAAASNAAVIGIFVYTFEGSFMKIMLALMLCESVPSIFANGVLEFLNLYIAKDQMHNYFVAFDKIYFLLPIINCAVFFICYYFAKPFLQRYRAYELRHPKIIFAVFMCYTGGALFSGITDFPSHDMKSGGAMLIKITLLGIFSLSFCFYLFYISYRNERIENEFLRQKQELIQGRYQEIQEQIENIESSRERVAAETELLTRLGREGRDSGEIQAYLQELRRQYRHGMANTYSNDLVLDAALCRDHELCAANNIADDFSAQYYRGKGDNGNLYVIISKLMDMGIGENKALDADRRFLFLRVASIANMTVVDFRCAISENFRESGRRFVKSIEKYGGSARWEPAKGKLSVSVMIQEKGANSESKEEKRN